MYNTNKMVPQLYSWYEKQKRPLPWRKTVDPYKIWLSEVMLQQTQVDTVIPYYKRWLNELPTLKDVADSTLETTLKLWEGLGYYARCRNFHKACQIVEKELSGQVPVSRKVFIKLPGVGEYTAAAVLSIAFGKPYPVLDGNVYRVMARLLAFSGNRREGNRVFLDTLENWIEGTDPGDFNQAFMELGSQVCRKTNPRCDNCPLSSGCAVYSAGTQEQFPVRRYRPPRPHKTVVVGIIWNGERFLIQKRLPKGHLGGLWEFPGGKVEDGEELSTALSREIAEETGLKIKLGRAIGKIEHAYSHFSISLHAYHCRLNGSSVPLQVEDRRWIAPVQIADFPFPKANHKLFNLLNEQRWRQ